MGKTQEIERYQSGFITGMQNALDILQNGGSADDIKASLRARAEWKVSPIPDALLDQLFKNGTKMAIVSQGILVCAALHDLFGFGEQRLKRTMEKVEKAGHYIEKGWVTYFDLVEGLKDSAKYESIVVEENKEAFGKYWRPDLEDTWTPADFIDPAVYQAMLRNLSMSERIEEDGAHTLIFPDGRPYFSWETPWEQVQAFDVLCGMFAQRVYDMVPSNVDVSQTIKSAMARSDPFGLIQEELAKAEKEKSSQAQEKSLGPHQSEAKPQPQQTHKPPKAKGRKGRKHR